MAAGTELYNQRPPFKQGILGAGVLNTDYPPADYEAGTVLWLRDVGPLGTFYSRTAGPPPGLVPQWTEISGDGRWGKYVVNDSATPLTLYTSIQAAYDAAVADGHDEADPAVVLIMPGLYVENLSITEGGIYFVGWSTPANQVSTIPARGIRVVGSVTVALAGDGETGMSNLAIEGPLALSGAALQQVTLDGVTVTTTTLAAVTFDNTGAGDSELATTNCRFETTNAGAAALAFGSSGARHRVTFRSTFFTVPATADAAIAIHDDVVGVMDSTVFGRVDVLASGYIVFDDCELTAHPGKAVARAVGAEGDPATLLMFFCQVFGDTAPMFLGSDADYTLVSTAVDGPLSFVATVTTNVERTFFGYKYGAVLVGGGPFVLDNTTDTVYCDPGSGTQVIQLPDPTKIHDGTELTFKMSSTHPDNALALSSLGTGTIDGAAGYTLRAASGKRAALQLRSRAGDNTWDVIGETGTAPAWANYVVSKGDPAAPYTSVQAAYDAAVAAGHDPATPAVVLIHPGVYAEAVTVTVGGIHFASFLPASEQATQNDTGFVTAPVTITGVFTVSLINLLAAGRTELSGLSLSGGLVIGGIQDQVVVLQGCLVTPTAVPIAVVFSNTGSSELIIRNSKLRSSFDDPTNVALASSGQAHQITIYNSQLSSIFPFGASKGAMTVAVTGSTATIIGSQITGTIGMTNSAQLIVRNSKLDANIGANVAFGFGVPGVPAGLAFYNCVIGAPANPAFAGTDANLTMAGCILNGFVQKSVNVTSLTEFQVVLRKTGTPLAGAGPFNFANNCDTIPIDPGGLAAVLNLFQVGQTPDGYTFTVKMDTANLASTIVVTAAGAELIDTASTLTLLAGTIGQTSVTIQCDQTAGKWRVLSWYNP